MSVMDYIFGLGLKKWLAETNPDAETVGRLLTGDARWITLKSGEEEEGGKAKGRRVLIGEKGKILGGNLPREAQGMNVREWGEKAGEIVGEEEGVESERKEILTETPEKASPFTKGEEYAATSGGERNQSSYSTTENEIRDAEKSFSQALGRSVEQVLQIPAGEPTESHRRAREFAQKAGIKNFVFFDTNDPQMVFVGGMMDHNSGTLYMNAGPHIPQEGETAHEVTHFISRTNPKLYKQFTKDLASCTTGYSLYRDALNQTRSEYGLAPLSDKWMKEEFFASIAGELHAPGSAWPDAAFSPSDLIVDREKAKRICDDFFENNAASPGQYAHQKTKPPGKKSTFTLTDNQEFMVREALDELANAEMQGKTRIEGIGVRNYGSTYPKWFKDNRFSSARVLPVLNKALSGDKLIPSQMSTLRVILEAKETQWNQMYGDAWRVEYSNEAPFALHGKQSMFGMGA